MFVRLFIDGIFTRTPADFAVWKSLGKGATDNEKKLVELFGEKDNVLLDFEFTPIHMAVLNLYSHEDRERPSLEQYVRKSQTTQMRPVL
jgi:hypothetical protein